MYSHMCVLCSSFLSVPSSTATAGGAPKTASGGGGSMDQHTVVHVPADAKVRLLNISVYIQSMFSVQVSLN
jgi:hypothetical protein